MTANQEMPERKRRSREEVKRLVSEFESSRLRTPEFCRNHSLALSTLQRHVKKRRLDKGEAVAWGEPSQTVSNRLVAVELARRDQDGNRRPAWALKIVLSSGRGIEVGRISIRTPSSVW
jgi:hypothetical protein